MGIELASSFDRKAGVPLDSLTRVANIAARDAIPALVRYVGMEVTVLDDGTGLQKKYWLKYGIDNADWSDDVGGGGSGSGVIQAADIAARDAIATDQRQEGLLVYVFSAGTEPKTFQLVGGISNAHWKEVVTQDSSTTITNKDIDGGTASNTSRSTIPRAATIEAATALTRKKGSILYNDFSDKILKDIGTGLKSVPNFDRTTLFAQEIVTDNLLSSWTQNLSGITSTFMKLNMTYLGEAYALSITSSTGDASGAYTIRKDFFVPHLFRGRRVSISFDYMSDIPANGMNCMITDLTNSASLVDESNAQSVILPDISGTRKTIVFDIPQSCQNIRVYFGKTITNTTAISDKFFAFSNLEIGTASLNLASMQGPRSLVKFNNGGNRGSTNTNVVYYTNIAQQEGTGVSAVNTAALGTEVHIKRSGIVTVTATRNQPVSTSGSQIVKNQTTYNISHPAEDILAGYTGSSGAGVALQFSGQARVVAGDIIRVVSENNTGSTNNNNTFSVVLHEDPSTSFIQDIDSFDLNRNPLVWSGTALSSTSPIGTYNTYTYAVNTNTKTLAASRPTQTDADMAVNGVQLFTRAYNAASTTGSPARFEIMIGKGFKGSAKSFLNLFKSTGKTTNGSLDFYSISTSNIGAQLVEYNEMTGILVIDAGFSGNTAATSSLFYFVDGTNQTNGYITISASKNASIAGISAPARYIVKTYESGTSWYEVYNDGWVRQGGYVTSGTSTNITTTYIVPMLNTGYTLIATGESNSTNAPSYNHIGYISRTSTSMIMNVQPALSKNWIAEGYGNSAAVKALGANPSY